MFQLFHVRPIFQNSMTPGSTDSTEDVEILIKLRLDDWIFWLSSWEVWPGIQKALFASFFFYVCVCGRDFNGVVTNVCQLFLHPTN